MTGLYNEFAIVLIASCVLLFYVPFITLVAALELGFLKNIKGKIKIVSLLVSFVLTASLTLLTIRHYRYNSLYPLFVYSIVLTLLFVLFKYLIKIKLTKSKTK